MPIIAFVSALPVTGGAQRVIGVPASGARVEAVYLRPAGGPLPLNFKVFSRPVSGGAQTQVGITVAAPTASGSRIDVKSPVEWIEAVVDSGGGGCLVDVHVTTGLESEGS